jgi:hypothetical protein
VPAARAVARTCQHAEVGRDVERPVASSRTTSLTGRSPTDVGVGNDDVPPASTFGFVKMPDPDTEPFSRTSNTWPGVVGVAAL